VDFLPSWTFLPRGKVFAASESAAHPGARKQLVQQKNACGGKKYEEPNEGMQEVRAIASSILSTNSKQ
jgi:hypothetical protein